MVPLGSTARRTLTQTLPAPSRVRLNTSRALEVPSGVRRVTRATGAAPTRRARHGRRPIWRMTVHTDTLPFLPERLWAAHVEGGSGGSGETLGLRAGALRARPYEHSKDGEGPHHTAHQIPVHVACAGRLSGHPVKRGARLRLVDVAVAMKFVDFTTFVTSLLVARLVEGLARGIDAEQVAHPRRVAGLHRVDRDRGGERRARLEARVAWPL